MNVLVDGMQHFCQQECENGSITQWLNECADLLMV
jgi:hypothetical protein